MHPLTFLDMWIFEAQWLQPFPLLHSATGLGTEKKFLPGIARPIN
jgi:hypothetical protein